MKPTRMWSDNCFMWLHVIYSYIKWITPHSQFQLVGRSGQTCLNKVDKVEKLGIVQYSICHNERWNRQKFLSCAFVLHAYKLTSLLAICGCVEVRYLLQDVSELIAVLEALFLSVIIVICVSKIFIALIYRGDLCQLLLKFYDLLIQTWYVPNECGQWILHFYFENVLFWVNGDSDAPVVT